MFSLESEIFLWIKPKEKKQLFCGKSGSMPTFRSTQKGKKCFLWWAYVCLTTRCYTILHLHQVFFRFRSDFLAFFARISYFKFLEFKEFNKTIIPFTLVGYETGYSQLGAMRFNGYLPSHLPTRVHGIIILLIITLWAAPLCLSKTFCALATFFWWRVKKSHTHLDEMKMTAFVQYEYTETYFCQPYLCHFRS